MNVQRPLRAAIALVFMLMVAAAHLPRAWGASDSSDEYNQDGTKKTFYWQGTQLNNLSRLGGNSNFEEEQRQANEGKDADAYLTSIREKMARQAQAATQEKSTLVYQGVLPGNPIELTHLVSRPARDAACRRPLRRECRDDEDGRDRHRSRGCRRSSRRKASSPLQLVIADTLDDFSDAKNVDAERLLAVLTLLQIPDRSRRAGKPDARNAESPDNLHLEVLWG